MQPFEPVVAVDNPAIEVVEVARRKSATIELHHWAQFGRNDGDDAQDHPFGAVARIPERLDNFDALEEALIGLGALGNHFFTQLGSELVQVDLLKERADSLRPHACSEGATVAVLGCIVFFLGEELHFLELGFAWVYDNVFFVIKDRAQRGNGQVKEQTHATRHGPVEPDVRDRACQLDVAHALTAHSGIGDFYAAAVADDPLVAYRFEFSAIAFPLFGCPENPFAEKPVALRSECPVIDGFRFLNLPV